MIEPWKRKEVIGDATLYLGDCLEILPTLPKVDAVITDPPFSEYPHGNAKSNRGVGHGNKAIDFGAIDFGAIDFGAIERVLAACGGLCDGWFISAMDWRHIAEVAKSAPAPWEFVRFGVWVKSNPMPQISADRPANGWDGILYLHNSAKRKSWNGGGQHGNYIGPVITDGQHPTAKPVGLCEKWVRNFTNARQTILDPFMGSGTTGVACMNLGRKFIGIEIEPKYFEIACERIENAQRQQRMFA